MRKYRKNAATPTRTEYGADLVEGLRAFPETAPFSVVLEQRNDELDSALATRLQARRPLVKARAKVRIANFLADTEVRVFARACESADGGRRGPVFDAAFPSGVVEVVAPVGKAQAAATQALIDRITQSKLPALVPVKAQWLPKLQASRDLLAAAAQGYQQALQAYQTAFGEEIALRDAHALLVDSLMGQVRATFPGDRDRQDAIFPDPGTGGGDDEEVDESPTPPVP